MSICVNGPVHFLIIQKCTRIQIPSGYFLTHMIMECAEYILYIPTACEGKIKVSRLDASTQSMIVFPLKSFCRNALCMSGFILHNNNTKLLNFLPTDFLSKSSSCPHQTPDAVVPSWPLPTEALAACV